jgi:hypothetical protein
VLQTKKTSKKLEEGADLKEVQTNINLIKPKPGIYFFIVHVRTVPLHQLQKYDWMARREWWDLQNNEIL